MHANCCCYEHAGDNPDCPAQHVAPPDLRDEVLRAACAFAATHQRFWRIEANFGELTEATETLVTAVEAWEREGTS